MSRCLKLKFNSLKRKSLETLLLSNSCESVLSNTKLELKFLSAQVIGSADFQVLFLQILVKLFFTFSWEAFTYWTSQQQKLLAPAGKFVGPIPDNQTGYFFKPCTNCFCYKDDACMLTCNFGLFSIQSLTQFTSS